MHPDVVVSVFGADQDGISHVTGVLSSYNSLSAIHIISHGSPGQISLGTTELRLVSLQDYTDQLSNWGLALTADGDILAYGCSVAKGDVGQMLIEQIAELTGADVSASTDPTGAAGFGGDWDLECRAGAIETRGLLQGFGATESVPLLATIDGDGEDNRLVSNAEEDDTLTGHDGDDVYVFQDNWGSDIVVESIDEGTDTLDFSQVTVDLTFTIHDDGTVSVRGGANVLDHIGHIEYLIGGSGDDTLAGPDGGTLWNLTGDNTGLVSGITFSDIEDLNGADTNADTFKIENEARWSGTIDGGGGANSLDASAVTEDLIFAIQEDGAISVNTAPDMWSSLGIIPQEILSLLSNGLDIESVEHVSELVGGNADNTFAFKGDADFEGIIDGGVGEINSLDYADYNGSVVVDFSVDPQEATATQGIRNLNRVVGAQLQLTVTPSAEGETVAYSDGDGVILDALQTIGLAAIEGTPGDDVLFGDSGINILDGKGGDDILTGGAKSDTYRFADGWGIDTIVDSGGEFDTLDFSLCTADLTFTIHAPDLEHLNGSASVTDGTNKIIATDGIEWLIDGQGNDTFVFEDGAVFDGIIGKQNWLAKLLGTSLVDYGSNTMDLSAYTVPVDVDLGVTIPYLEITLFQHAWQDHDNHASTDMTTIVPYFHNIANVIGGSAGDFIWGSSEDNVLKGGDGHDEIFGRDGADTFDGGAGDDFLYGGFDESALLQIISMLTTTALLRGGDPTTVIADQFLFSALDLAQHVLGGGTIQSFVLNYFAGDENVVIYADALSAVTVDLAWNSGFDESSFVTNTSGGAGVDTIVDIHNVIGSPFDDTLTGNLFDNTLGGGEGDDKLYGEAGSDTLIGGAGDDLIDGGDLTDSIGSTTDSDLFGDRDIVSYQDASGVTIDLGITGAQDTRRWEIVPTGHDDPIDGLVEGREYEVVSVAGDTFKLRSRNGDDIDVELAPPGGTHRFEFDGGALSFTPSDSAAIDYATDKITITGHGFIDNQEIIYNAGGFDPIGGLTEGQTYKVEMDDADRFRLKLMDNTLVGLILAAPEGTHTFDLAGVINSFEPSDGSSVDYTTDVFAIVGHGLTNGDIVTYGAGGEKVFTTSGAGRDTIVDVEGITGSGSGDELIGNDNHNVIKGGGGNDLIRGGGGYDVLIGGGGSDTVSYDWMDSGVFVNLWLPLPMVYNADRDTNTLKEIENVIGSDHKDYLIGSFGNNILEGGYGDDVLVGTMGSDVYRFEDSWGFDTIIDDIAAGLDWLDKNADVFDHVQQALTTAGEWIREADEFTNLNILDEAKDTTASRIPDTLDFSAVTADLTVNIRGFGDVHVAYGTNQTNDVAEMEVVVTGGGNDTFVFAEDPDPLKNGPDTFTGTLDGGSVDWDRYPDADADVNTIDYSAVTDSVVVDLETPDDGGPGKADGTEGVYSIHNVVGGKGDDTLKGSGENNLLLGGGGNDLIEGRDGDDVLEGGAGNDVLIGGEGFDMVSYVHYENLVDSTGVTIDLNLDDGDQNTVGEGIDILKEIEGAVGSDHDDTITGDEQDNMLIGGGGNDVIYGMAGADFLSGDGGDDSLFGGAEDDMIEGGLGDDLMNGGAGNDTVSYIYPAKAVTVDLSITSKQDTVGAGVDTLTGFENILGSIENDTLIGNDEDNVLTGSAGDDVLRGMGGKDTLLGEEGNDKLFGGESADILSGSLGDDLLDGYTEGGDPADDIDIDSVSYVEAEGGVVIDLRISGVAQDTISAGKDTLQNVEGVMGSEYDDILTGSADDNIILGQGGDDILEGGQGDDVIFGGEGFDFISYSLSTTRVFVDLGISWDQETGDSTGWDEIAGIEGVIGSDLNDAITGSEENNVLIGGLGEDDGFIRECAGGCHRGPQRRDSEHR